MISTPTQVGRAALSCLAEQSSIKQIHAPSTNTFSRRGEAALQRRVGLDLKPGFSPRGTRNVKA